MRTVLRAAGALAMFAASGAPAAQAGTDGRAVPVVFTYRTVASAKVVAETVPEIAFTCRSEPAAAQGGLVVTCTGSLAVERVGAPGSNLTVKLRHSAQAAVSGAAASYISGRQWGGGCAGTAGTICRLRIGSDALRFSADLMAMP